MPTIRRRLRNVFRFTQRTRVPHHR
jgi:hypothetical protein